jgi:hypothetical protein
MIGGFMQDKIDKIEGMAATMKGVFYAFVVFALIATLVKVFVDPKNEYKGEPPKVEGK